MVMIMMVTDFFTGKPHLCITITKKFQMYIGLKRADESMIIESCL